MIMKERPYESMTPKEKESSFVAICYWVDTTLTDSVYVLDCATPEEAESGSYDFFFAKINQENPFSLFKKISRIDILPQGKGRYDQCEPVFSRKYVNQLLQ
jgi:hypothetical protein